MAGLDNLPIYHERQEEGCAIPPVEQLDADHLMHLALCYVLNTL